MAKATPVQLRLIGEQKSIEALVSILKDSGLDVRRESFRPSRKNPDDTLYYAEIHPKSP